MRRESTNDPIKVLARFAAGQWGVVTRAELIECGLSAEQVQRMVARGHLHLLHRGVYAVGHRNVTTEGRFLAAVKACGPEAVLSHYCAACHRGWLKYNGRPIDVMVDTGASMVALTYEDAERAGLSLKPSDFTGRVSTANGTAAVAPVMLDRVSIGHVQVRNVRAAVCERGKLEKTLLGMSFLSRLDRVDIKQGRLTLIE